MAERYQSVNGAWPDAVPALTAAEATSAAKRLYRLGMGRAFRGKTRLTSGRRYNYVRRGVLFVNPKGHHFGGWRDLVHDLSHYCHRRKHPGHKPHDGRGTHAFIERTMIEHVVNSGWLDGRLKRPDKPTKQTDVRALRQRRVLERLAAWEAKRKRAERALAKLRRQARYYEKSLAAA
jgi:hypothetical protein